MRVSFPRLLAVLLFVASACGAATTPVPSQQATATAAATATMRSAKKAARRKRILAHSFFAKACRPRAGVPGDPS